MRAGPQEFHGVNVRTRQTPDPVAVLLCGIGGTGKSIAARHLSVLLGERGHTTKLIRFDEYRKALTPPETDPFSPDPNVKAAIYNNAIIHFSEFLRARLTLVIDSGLSNERIRQQLKQSLRELRVVHIHCPLLVAVYRDTIRSILQQSHERGRFLHLQAIASLLNPFAKEKFPQPGITYPFEYPHCADAHVNTFRKKPRSVALEIMEKLQL